MEPSALAFRNDDGAPRALDRDGLARIRDAFAKAARRPERLELDVVQLHNTSPLSNRRDVEYGGSLENRMRFPLKVFNTVRAAFPTGRPVTVRVSASDWAPGGWDLEQTVAFARALEARGCSAIHVSSGGLTPDQQIAVGPNYHIPFARTVKAAVRVPVVAVGLIMEFEHAEAILSTGDADLIALARAILYDPRRLARRGTFRGAY